MNPINRRDFLYLSTAGAMAATALPGLLSASPSRLYDASIVIDGLGGPGGRGKPGDGMDAAELADVRDSGLTAIHMTIGAVGTMAPLAAFEKIIREAAFWEAEIEQHPDTLFGIRQAADFSKAKAAGRTGLIYGLQDGVSFEDDLDRLDALHRFGVRVIQPTYNRRNLLGDGCMEPADAGLSRSGHDAVGKMNELGILVDLSHCGRRTTADAIAASSRPVSFTHTGCHALADHPRHRTDAEMKKIADGGGVTGIYIMPYMARGRQPTAADVVAHLEHAVNVAGEDHVSIGTDGRLSPVELTPEYVERFQTSVRERRERGIAAPFETEEGFLFAGDLNTPRRLETLTGLLMERGHSESRIEKILGANLVRLFGDTW